MIEKKTKLLEDRYKTSENKFSYANLFWNGLDMSDIRQRAYLAWLTLFLGFCAMDVEAQAETELLRDVLSKPIKIERDEVVEIDGSSPPMSTSDQQCQTSRQLSEQRNLRSIKKIKIFRNGEFKVIVLDEELEVSEG